MPCARHQSSLFLFTILISPIPNQGILSSWTPPKILRPAGITVNDSNLEIQWSDGHVSLYPHKFLRQRCRCALCSGEPVLTSSGLAMPNASLPSVPDNVSPTKFGQVGNYGLSINWSDGHSTGIYSFNYLRQICQCKICTGNTSKSQKT